MSSHDEKMPPRSLKVRITHPYFDNVVVHEPGAEITLADRKAFSNASMEWVEKPATEALQPVAPTPEVPTPEVLQAKVARKRSGDVSGAHATGRFKARNSSGRFAKPATPPASAEEVPAPAPIAAPLEEGATRSSGPTAPSESASSSESTAPTEPTPSQQRADASAGNGAGSEEQSMSAIANVR